MNILEIMGVLFIFAVCLTFFKAILEWISKYLGRPPKEWFIKYCGHERPLRKVFCQLKREHKGSHQAVIFWEDK